MPHKDPEARRAWQRKYYKEHPERVHTKEARKRAMDKYRAINRERWLERGRKYHHDHKDERRIKSKEYWTNKGNERARKAYELLTDKSLERQLKKTGFSKDDIKKYPELIELKRILLKTKRLCKTSNNSEKVSVSTTTK